MVPEAVREGRAATLNLPHAFTTALRVQSRSRGSAGPSLGAARDHIRER